MYKRLLNRVFAVSVLFALLGSGGVQAAGGTLIFGLPADHDIMDPHATGGWVTYQVTYNIFETFVKEDLTDASVMTPKLIPGLATSWEVSPDGSQYTFNLREGVKFHDGEPFNADAVMVNFDRFRNTESPTYFDKTAAFVSAYTQWIAKVEKLGDMSVRITLTQPNYEWLRTGLQSFGQPLMISPAAARDAAGEVMMPNPP